MRLFFIICIFVISLTDFTDDVLGDCKLEEFLTNFSSLHASFVQEDSDGNISYGVINILSPKYIRWEYITPNPSVIVINGNVLSYYDYALDEKSHKILSKKHEVLRLLLEPALVLKNSSRSVEHGMAVVTEHLSEERTVELKFNCNPVTLYSIKIFDKDGGSILIKFSDVKYNINMPQSLFNLY